MNKRIYRKIHYQNACPKHVRTISGSMNDMLVAAGASLWAEKAEAAKLAASLNALKAKSAAAEGASLRLVSGAKLTVDDVVTARSHGDFGKDWANGGGVETYNGTFTMKGGIISGNSVSGSVFSFGGGVYVSDSAVFTMFGGTYTKGGAAQSGGSDIVFIDADTGGRTNDTLIAIPKGKR
ncbi:MAG: hypothetical protein LBD07_05945 [Spirochaetaceae bacterium]|jgi:hypothetical protein|nr:hypothetical protein [Spirochaetaceae bacterium]